VSVANDAGDAAALEERVRAALAPRRSAGRASALSCSLTFAWRALLKVKHMPEQLFDVIVTPIMFTVIFTYLFGGALAGSPDEYLQFLLPGILVQTVLFTSVYTGFTLNTDIGKGVFDRFRSLPIWKPAPLVGAMLGDSVRYSISSLVVILVGLIMGFRPPAGVPGLFAAVLLLDVFAFGVGWTFTVLALVVRSPSTVMTLSWLVLMPLTFASNIFVDPRTMPGWLQTFVAVNPVALLVHAVRGIMTGSVTASDIALSLIAPALLTLVCAPAAMVLYERER
jgi:daunorubicin/doxorubicin transport system permease protein